MKQKKISNVDVYQQMNKIFEKADIHGQARRDYCQYIGDGEKYCKATTNKTCKHCHTFSPTTNVKIKVIVEYTAWLENELQKLRLENNLKDARIQNLQDMNRQMHQYYDEYLTEYSAVGKSISRHRKKMEKAKK